MANMKVDYKQNSYKEKGITTRVVQMVIKKSLTHTSHWRKSEGQTRETYVKRNSSHLEVPHTSYQIRLICQTKLSTIQEAKAKPNCRPAK